MEDAVKTPWARIPGAIRFYQNTGEMTFDYFTCRYKRVVKEPLEGGDFDFRIREEEQEGKPVYLRDLTRSETVGEVLLAAKVFTEAVKSLDIAELEHGGPPR